MAYEVSYTTSIAGILLYLLIFLTLLHGSTGYYQQPEVVQFTTPPRDAVVCQGCEINLSCSILRQSSAAGEGHVPMPELEWIFNGTRIDEILSDARVLVRDSATHRTAQLSITNVTAFHNGVYQCRANDGNDSTVCREGASDIHCLPTTTISTPARIQIVDEVTFVEDVISSCSGVVVLPCGRRLLGGASVVRPILTWTRSGEELNSNSDAIIVLDSGDLVVNTNSTGNIGGLYECVGSFVNTGHRNVTLARHNISSRYRSTSREKMDNVSRLRITSSVETVFEGESVELVCEAFLEDDDPCLPYNVTWRSSSLVSGRDHQSDGHALLDNGSGNSLQMNGHVLRISRVSSTLRYCCLVHSDGETMEECIVISVTQPQPNVSSVNSSTVFLGRRGASNVTQIDCSPSPSSSFSSSPASRLTSNMTSNVTWYRNGQLLANVTNSTLYLTVSGEPLTSDVFGVYQCFRAGNTYHSVEEISITRVLPFGLTNPPSVPVIQEVPYPDPAPSDGVDQAAFLVVWDPPLLTGGLSRSALRYNVTITYSFRTYNQVLTSDTHSLLVYILAFEYVRISVVVVINSTEESYFEVASQQISETGPQFATYEVQSQCLGQVLYPPNPSLNCERGVINLSWTRVSENRNLFGGSDRRLIEVEYAAGNCTHPNGSVDMYLEEVLSSPHTLYKEVGTYCRFTMASTKRAPSRCNNFNKDSDCFCYDPTLVMQSDTVECYVQGSVRFVSSVLEVFENDSSAEVCVRVEGYGFAVNISTDGHNLSSTNSHQLYIDHYNGSPNTLFCVNFTILDDNIVEDAKNFTVSLATDRDLVTVGDPAIVQIIDNDYAIVHFNQSSYAIRKSGVPLSVCVRIENELEVNFPVTIQSEDDTAHAGIDYAPVNVTLLFTPESNPIQCFDVSTTDSSVIKHNKVFKLTMTTASDRLFINSTASVFLLATDENQTISAYSSNDSTTVIISTLLALAFLVVTLTLAGSVYYLLKKQRLKNYRLSQNDVGSIDWSVEPAVLIGTDNTHSYFHPRQLSESDFDSKTLLDYLGPPTVAGSNEIDNKLPLHILSTEQESIDSKHPQDDDNVEKKHESYHLEHTMNNCYNVSMESGVVLDSDIDPGVDVRNDGSSNLSRSLPHVHSYIGMGNDDIMCACYECRQQRERLHSTKSDGCTTLEHSASQLSKLNDVLIGDLSSFDKEQDGPLYCHMCDKDSCEPSVHCETDYQVPEKAKQMHNSHTQDQSET